MNYTPCHIVALSTIKRKLILKRRLNNQYSNKKRLMLTFGLKNVSLISPLLTGVGTEELLQIHSLIRKAFLLKQIVTLAGKRAFCVIKMDSPSVPRCAKWSLT